MNDRFPIDLKVNGQRYHVDVPVYHTLLDFLRDDLGLTGTKECCVVGECGACTVIVNGRTVNSCLMLAVEADGCEVLTVEGLAVEGKPRARCRRPSSTTARRSAASAPRAS